MIETIFATDDEEMTPGTPEEGGEGGDEGMGGGDMPTSEPEGRLNDGEGDEEAEESE